MTMATVIYNCKKCKVGRRVGYPHRDSRGSFYRTAEDGRMVYPGRAFGPADERKGDGVCTCGRFMDWDRLEAHFSESVRCDARCTNARGHKCECSCSGENHGAGWTSDTSGLFTGLTARPA